MNEPKSEAINDTRQPGLAPATCSATALPDWHRLTLLHDGKEIMGCTITSKRPENHEQMTSLIRELLAVMEAPTVPDPEVLGDRSPNESSSATGGATTTERKHD